MEYVRICDVYGAGFFYIPGTETCLRVSGYVWYQIAAGTFGGDALTAGGGAPLAPFASIGTETVGYNDSVADDGWMVSTRARLNVDARSETEWGTLRAYLRYQATWGAPADGNATVDQAYIELGGLIMGYTESFWADSKIGGAANYGSHSWGGMYYGYQQRHLIGYRFEGGNGFFG
ncbi:porin, partial [Aquibium sp. A9E412]|uniref:porin n=1 Tax=Aquibium sp. A9E412 TaxID=2976767 RepID=UPI0025B1F9E1